MSTASNSVFDSIRQVVGVTYDDATYSKDILDMYFLRLARQQGVRLPSGSEPDRFNYFGAYVFPPRAGVNHNVTYVDLASLYPNLMRALNVGPDTIIGTQSELEASQWTEDDCVWGYIDTRPVKHVESGEPWREYTDGSYKMVYSPSQNTVRWVDDPDYERCYYLHPDVRGGFIKEGIEDLIQLKYEFTGNTYEAIKAHVTNSSYGVLGFATATSSFRLYDWRIAESITLAGRKVIQETAKSAREHMAEYNDIPESETYVAIGDTDGAGVCWPKAPTRAVMIDAIEDAVGWLNEEGYSSFMAEEFGVPQDSHYMEVEVESYATRVFVPAENPNSPEDDRGVKKRYAQHIMLDEGDDGLEETDEVDVTGLEAERSDVAPITRDVQRTVLEAICRKERQKAKGEVFPLLRETEQRARDGEVPIEELAKRGGIGQRLSEYGTESRRPGPIYRGAKYMRDVFGVEVGQGSKPFVVYLDSPEGLPQPTYSAETAEDGDVVDAIAVEHERDLPDGIDINYGKNTEKAIVDPMAPIVETLGWSWSEIRHQHEQTGFENFQQI